MGSAGWTFRAVSPETWPDMAALFAGKGGPKSCWCMVWRTTADGKAAPSPADDRRAAVQELALSGGQIGILGYDQGIPIAWCSIAPRATFGAGLGDFGADVNLWSLTCFFIRNSHRHQGGFAALLNAAETFAASNGAAAIEAYPVDPDSPSFRFSGFVPNFARAGYTQVGQIGTRRKVMRKALFSS